MHRYLVILLLMSPTIPILKLKKKLEFLIEELLEILKDLTEVYCRFYIYYLPELLVLGHFSIFSDRPL